MPIKIAALLTCFNRRNLTLRCLEQLFKQKNAKDIELSVFLVDDGCTDGTAQAIKKAYPKVNIILGNGSLYWNGGMRLAWNTALKSDDYDFYLWVNDDATIYDDSLARIINSFHTLINQGEQVGAILGSMVSPTTGRITYGGKKSITRYNPLKTGDIIEPTEHSQECDFVNGNFVLIPKASINSIGILSDKFTHGMGDFDYGLRLKKAGYSTWIAPGTYGTCEANTAKESWRNKTLTIEERVRKIETINQLPPADEWMYYIKEHGGLVWPILWLRTLIRKIAPRIWIRLQDIGTKN